MSPLAAAWYAGWEKDFTLVQWDQRGAGRTNLRQDGLGDCQRNRDGIHATQADRLRTLTLASRQLREAGFRQMRAGSLKGKHVEVLPRTLAGRRAVPLRIAWRTWAGGLSRRPLV